MSLKEPGRDRPLDETARDEAAAWFSTQRRSVMSSEELARFKDWRADSRNQATLDSMHQLWGELSGLKGAIAPAVQRRSLHKLGLAASLVLVVAASAAFILHKSGFFAPVVQTAVGEQRATTLPDGSIVSLNVATRIDYQVSRKRRDVRLGDGEALFVVHKDATRPFTVLTGHYAIEVLGTTFNVRQRDGGLQIAVLEGSVSLTGPDGAELARLTAGQRISLRPKVESQASSRPSLERFPVQEMAEWRLRIVSYEDASVAEIVKDLNRFFPRRLQVSDPDIAARRVTLRLQVTDHERTLQTLSALLGVKIRASGDTDLLTDTP